MKRRLSRRKNKLSRRNIRSIHKNSASKKRIRSVNRRTRRRSNNRNVNRSKRKRQIKKSLRKRRPLRKGNPRKLNVIQMGGSVERNVLCDQIIQYLPSSLTFIKINDTYVDERLQRYKDMVGYQRFRTIVDNNPMYEESDIITRLYDADLTDIDAFKRSFTGIKRRVLDELTDYILEFNMIKKYTQSGGALSKEIDNSYQNVVGNVDWFNVCCGFDKYDDIFEVNIENNIKGTGLVLNNIDEIIQNIKDIVLNDYQAFKRMMRLRLSYCSEQPDEFLKNMPFFQKTNFERSNECIKNNVISGAVLNVYDEYKGFINSKDINLSKIDRVLALIYVDARISELSKYIILENERLTNNKTFRDKLDNVLNSEKNGFELYKKELQNDAVKEAEIAAEKVEEAKEKKEEEEEKAKEALKEATEANLDEMDALKHSEEKNEEAVEAIDDSTEEFKKKKIDENVTRLTPEQEEALAELKINEQKGGTVEEHIVQPVAPPLPETVSTSTDGASYPLPVDDVLETASVDTATYPLEKPTTAYYIKPSMNDTDTDTDTDTDSSEEEEPSFKIVPMKVEEGAIKSDDKFSITETCRDLINRFNTKNIVTIEDLKSLEKGRC